MTKNACLALWFALVLGSGVRAQQADQQEKTEKQELEAAVAAAVATDATLSSGKEHASDRPVLHRRNPRYMLRAGDVLELSFSLTPEFNQTVTIQPDGFITLMEIGDVHVQGISTPELVERIRREYSKILHAPLINVVLQQFEAPYFIAGGQVAKPGKYELRGDTTVAEAVSIAGGFTPAAKHSRVLLIRRSNEEEVEVRILDIKNMLKKADLREDAHLQPGDMVYVPQNFFSKWKDLVIPRVGTSINPIP